ASLGLDWPRGVLVNTIYPDWPDDRAGLKEGDVVLAVDGMDVNNDQAVRFRLATYRVGDRARLQVWSRGRERTATLRAEEPPEKPAPDRRRITGRNPFAGVQIVNLSPAFNDANGLDLFQTGVAVESVDRGSVADYYGLRPGDVIEQVNGAAVATSGELEDLVVRFEGRRAWTFVVERGGRRLQRSLRF
ncbi:MAG: PDZ domain-containing protein, partial [Caulobacterales bacterium]|nr:PDZ domain-containing protein [Caulobacterales bacterium]